jgi:hypothetical protein
VQEQGNWGCLETLVTCNARKEKDYKNVAILYLGKLRILNKTISTYVAPDFFKYQPESTCNY